MDEKATAQVQETTEPKTEVSEKNLNEVFKILQAMIFTLPTLNSHKRDDRTYHNSRVERMVGLCKLAANLLGANIDAVEDEITKKIREAFNAIEEKKSA